MREEEMAREKLVYRMVITANVHSSIYMTWRLLTFANMWTQTHSEWNLQKKPPRMPVIPIVFKKSATLYRVSFCSSGSERASTYSQIGQQWHLPSHPKSPNLLGYCKTHQWSHILWKCAHYSRTWLYMKKSYCSVQKEIKIVQQVLHRKFSHA